MLTLSPYPAVVSSGSGSQLSSISPSLQQPKKKNRSVFTKSEDEMLKILVKKYGDYDWNTIADGIPGKTPRQCRDRYRNYLSPEIINGTWSKEEDALLISMYVIYGPMWTRIAQFFPNRSATNIKNHFASLQSRMQKKQLIAAQKSELIQKIDQLSYNLSEKQTFDHSKVLACTEEISNDANESIFHEMDFDPFDVDAFEL